MDVERDPSDATLPLSGIDDHTTEHSLAPSRAHASTYALSAFVHAPTTLAHRVNSQIHLQTRPSLLSGQTIPDQSILGHASPPQAGRQAFAPTSANCAPGPHHDVGPSSARLSLATQEPNSREHVSSWDPLGHIHSETTELAATCGTTETETTRTVETETETPLSRTLPTTTLPLHSAKPSISSVGTPSPTGPSPTGPSLGHVSTNVYAHIDRTGHTSPTGHRDPESSMDQTVGQSMEKAIDPSIDQSIGQPIGQTMDQTIDQAIDQTMDSVMDETVVHYPIESTPTTVDLRIGDSSIVDLRTPGPPMIDPPRIDPTPLETSTNVTSSNTNLSTNINTNPNANANANKNKNAISHPTSHVNSFDNITNSTNASVSTPASSLGHGLYERHLLKPKILVKPHQTSVHPTSLLQTPSLFAKPLLLQPLMILPRARLPLAALDLTAPHGLDLVPARHYETRARVLHLESRRGTEPLVLLAYTEASRCVYVIELADTDNPQHRGNNNNNNSQGTQLATVCKLYDSVDLFALQRHALISHTPYLEALGQQGPGTVPTDQPITTPGLHKAQKEKRLAIEALHSEVRKKQKIKSPTSPLSTPLTEPVPTGHGLDTAHATSDPVPTSLPPEDALTAISHTLPSDDIAMTATSTPSITASTTPTTATSSTMAAPTVTSTETSASASVSASVSVTGPEILETLRSQYWDALYRSKGSLAYFAKGPLSRARAAFQRDADGPLDMAELIDFLRSMILPANTLDKKFRESIPEILHAMKLDIYDDSDDAAHTGARSAVGKATKGKRKKKTIKLGKNGLYSYEDALIRNWWRAHKPSAAQDAHTPPTDHGGGGGDNDDGILTETQVKSHIALLRTRETQLQVIVILETLALEAIVHPADDPPLPGMDPAAGESSPPPPSNGNTGLTLPKKRKKQQDLPTLLDLHVDRLCIWQSTATDEQRLLETTHSWKTAASPPPTASSSSSSGPGPDPSHKSASAEPLRDFCVDIIVPFFASRLPKRCDGVSRKLGGPSIIASPAKHKSRRHHHQLHPSTSRRPHAKQSQKDPRANGSNPSSSSSSSSSLHPPQKSLKRSVSSSSSLTALSMSSDGSNHSGKSSTTTTRTLHRALSTEQFQSRRSLSRGPSAAIAALRSVAATSVPGLKREGSEPAVALASTAPQQRGGDRDVPRRRSGLVRSQSVAALNRTSQTSSLSSRAQKQALADAEWHDAISAIRKPNRALPAAAAAAAVTAAATGAQRKTKPGRQTSHASQQTSQTRQSQTQFSIKATPMAPKARDPFAGRTAADPLQRASFGGASLPDDFFSKPSTHDVRMGHDDDFIPSTGHRDRYRRESVDVEGIGESPLAARPLGLARGSAQTSGPVQTTGPGQEASMSTSMSMSMSYHHTSGVVEATPSRPARPYYPRNGSVEAHFDQDPDMEMSFMETPIRPRRSTPQTHGSNPPSIARSGTLRSLTQHFEPVSLDSMDDLDLLAIQATPSKSTIGSRMNTPLAGAATGRTRTADRSGDQNRAGPPSPSPASTRRVGRRIPLASLPHEDLFRRRQSSAMDDFDMDHTGALAATPPK